MGQAQSDDGSQTAEDEQAQTGSPERKVGVRGAGAGELTPELEERAMEVVRAFMAKLRGGQADAESGRGELCGELRAVLGIQDGGASERASDPVNAFYLRLVEVIDGPRHHKRKGKRATSKRERKPQGVDRWDAE
jgi:hypothetical protein